MCWILVAVSALAIIFSNEKAQDKQNKPNVHISDTNKDK